MVRSGEKQLDLPRLRGAERMKNAPRARTVSFDSAGKRLKVELLSGVIIEVPIRLIQIFENASERDIAEAEILLDGLYIRWPNLDEDLRVQSLIEGTFGTAKWMSGIKERLADLGRKGGRSRSKSKIDAARINGAKGGRPKKLQPA